MKLSDIVCFDSIVPELKADDRDGVIRELIESLASAGKIDDGKVKDIIKAVIKRENEASTGIGKGVAVPHVKHTSIKKVVAAVGRSGGGINFSSLDKQPVYSIILLLSPKEDSEKHLQAMEAIFRNLQKDDFRRFLRQAGTVQQIKETILEADESGQ